MDHPIPDPRRIVLVTPRDDVAERLASVLDAANLSVVRVRSGADLFDRLAEGQPDAIVLDGILPRDEIVELCQRIHDEPRIESVTPIVVLSDGDEGQGADDLLRAGVWDRILFRGNANELALKLRVFTGAKREVDVVKGTSLLDVDTDLYNVRGLIRRVRETGAAADRYRGPIACMALSATLSPHDNGHPDERFRDLAVSLDDVRRASDVVGRLGSHTFAIVGPGTGPHQAARMAERILEELNGRMANPSEAAVPRMRAGYAAVEDFHEAGLSPVEILIRALRALQAVQDHPNQQVREFTDDLPPFRDSELLKLR